MPRWPKKVVGVPISAKEIKEAQEGIYFTKSAFKDFARVNELAQRVLDIHSQKTLTVLEIVLNEMERKSDT
jgi:hypothetical protein